MNTGQTELLTGPENLFASGSKIIALEPEKRARHTDRSRHRFKLLEFKNAGGSTAWRVSGYRRDGSRVRENFADAKAAQTRQAQLEAEFLSRTQDDSALRATRLTDTQLRIAETCFIRLDDDSQMISAINYWLEHGRQHAVKESPRLDDAFAQFGAWLRTCELRDLSRKNLRPRVNVFFTCVPKMRVADVTPDTIDTYLGKRAVSPKSKDNDRRAVSRFFSWCIERPRRWSTMNPCREIRIARGDDAPPAVLSLKECKALLRKAESFEQGRLVPYVAVCLFGGLRPSEAARLTWDAVNLTDGEIRLERHQTKTGQSRVVEICDTLRAWLKAYEGKPFFTSNWRKDFDQIKKAAGYGGREDKEKEEKKKSVD